MSLSLEVLRFIDRVRAQEAGVPVSKALMTDEEIIAADLGEVVGNQFLFWDRIIDPYRTTSFRPAQRIADDYLNEHRQTL